MSSLKAIRVMVLAAAASGAVALPTASLASVNIAIGVSVGTPPPVLPVYAQPPIPAPGYIWTPGYWAWGPAGYYWVPGVWVMPPAVGMLWTPGYWGWGGSAYVFHAGYWGPHIGFYGGVNYGYGYTGHGYEGGYWRNGAFAYNRTVNNITNVHVTNVYNRTVVVNNVNRVSYNGGRGGINVQPSGQERAALNEHHFEPTQNQMLHEQSMRNDRGQLASVNHGQPQTMAMSRVGERSNMQQQRIANGVSSGALTPHETRNLESRQAAINQQVRTDRQANGGTLTPQERQQVNREQNRTSQQIYNQKHDAQTYNPGPSEVGQRQANQQQRIANGINSGRMNAGEAARAENRQQNINQQVRTERQANGGRLNQQERQQVNREQNRASQQIHNEKHN